jgi:hypothetical protein
MNRRAGLADISADIAKRTSNVATKKHIASVDVRTAADEDNESHEMDLPMFHAPELSAVQRDHMLGEKAIKSAPP